MAKTDVTQWSIVAGSNTDIGGISIAEGMFPDAVNNAIRELMAQIARFNQTGPSFLGNPYIFTWADDGAAAGPQLFLQRNSANPAINDNIANLYFQANNSSAVMTSYAVIAGAIRSPAAGSENADLRIRALVAGVDTPIVIFGPTITLQRPVVCDSTLDVTGAISGSASITAAGNITATAGGITVGGKVTGNQSFVSTTNEARLATTGVGTIKLQPRGDGVALGTVTIDGNGNIDSAGSLALSTQITVGTYAQPAGSIGTLIAQNGAIATANNTACPMILNRSTAGTTSLACLQVVRNGTLLNAIMATPTVVSFDTASDYRLKENVTDMAGSIERLDLLRPVHFTWIADPAAGQADGFLAHELQAVVPTAVHGEKDGEEMQGVDHSKVVPLLVGAIKELLAAQRALSDRITILEAT